MASQLVLVRHGVTEWNQQRRFQGQTDTQLSDEGWVQACCAGRRLAAEPVAALYTSDLIRARRTADAIGQTIGLPVLQDAGLRERSYGIFEGRTHEEIRRDFADEYRRWAAREPDFALPGGESLRAFHGRVQQTLLRIASMHPGQTAVLVTHGGFLDCAYRVASGLELDAPRTFDLLNASLNRIAWDGERFALSSWAEVDHLAQSLDDADSRA
jgi:2,3-bisphosphoglycerate-dependent phosphoglycerate mutase